MLKSEIIAGLKRTLQETIKEMKVALLFVIKNDSPMHDIVSRKVLALESVVKGIDIVNLGGTSDDVKDSLDVVLGTVDEAIANAHCTNCAQQIYEERAFVLGLKAQFTELDQLLSRGEIPQEEEESVTLN